MYRESPPARQAQHEVEDLLARAPEPLVEELGSNLINVVVRRPPVLELGEALF